MADSLFAGLASYAPAFNAAANIFGAFSNYSADKETAKAEAAWQAYSNTMTRLSDAQNQNAITTNEILATQQLSQQGIEIQQQDILTSAKEEVAAAAAGTAGNSVNDVTMDIHRNAAIAERQRQITLSNTYLASDQQRLSSSMQSQLKQDYSLIPTPNLGSYLLPAAATISKSLFKDDLQRSTARPQATAVSTQLPLLSSSYVPGQITESNLPPA